MTPFGIYVTIGYSKRPTKRAPCIGALFAISSGIFAHFLRFQFRTIFTPQSRVISGRETMTCIGNRTGEMRA